MMKSQNVKVPNYVAKRRLFHIFTVLVFFAVPFINVGKRPLLRFDVNERAIYFIGNTISPAQIFSFLLGLLAFIFFFLYLTQVFGRIWCGWMCPQTVLLEPLRLIKTPKKNQSRFYYYFKRVLLAFCISAITTLGLIHYTTDLSGIGHELAAGNLRFVWYGFFVVTFINIVLIGRRFCTTVCPYSMYQSVMFDADTLRVAMIPGREGECIDCGACVRICPSWIDIRKGLSNKCVLCASCVDACGRVMYRLNKYTLIGYIFGRGKISLFKGTKLISLLLAIMLSIAAAVSILSVDSMIVKVTGKQLLIQGDDPYYQVNLYLKNKYEGSVFLTMSSDGNVLYSSDIDSKAEKEITINVPVGVNGTTSLNITVVNGKSTEKTIMEIE